MRDFYEKKHVHALPEQKSEEIPDNSKHMKKAWGHIVKMWKKKTKKLIWKGYIGFDHKTQNPSRVWS